MNLDKPIREGIELVRALKSAGYHIVIVSGRVAEDQMEASVRYLEELGVPFDAVVMRRRGDRRRDAEFKVSVIESLVRRGYMVEIVVDDSDRVCEAVERRFPWIRVVRFKKGSHVLEPLIA